ncbi:ImmA/IrrE family metallo-endopeptidase, partial [Salmonella enterica]|nr:ImmA/IrrE family metallo-endopeptidase [Salmonella enterica]
MENNNYFLRGNRVCPMNREEIARRAAGFCRIFNIKHSRRKNKNFDKVMEKMIEYGITIDPIDDKEWFSATRDYTIGHYDPSTLTISIPDRVYINASKGERDALFIVLHEIGHLMLAHKALLHHSNTPPQQNEDAEWQADLFAEMILSQMGFNM